MNTGKYHPDFREYIKKNLAKDELVWTSYKFGVYKIENAIGIFDNNCADEFIYHMGKIYLCVENINELLHKKYFNDIKSMLNGPIKHSRCFKFISCYLENNQKEAYKELNTISKADERSDFLLLFAYGYSVLFNKKNEAITLLKKSEKKTIDSWNLRMCAKAWLNFEQDVKNAKRLLLMIEKKFKKDYSWLFFAEAWNDVFKGEEEENVLRCLDQAHRYEVNDPYLYSYFAELYWQLYFETDVSKKYLEKAKMAAKQGLTDKSDKFNFWIKLACKWKLIFNENEEARNCMNEAKNCMNVYNSKEFMKYAEHLIILFKAFDELDNLITQTEKRVYSCEMLSSFEMLRREFFKEK